LNLYITKQFGETRKSNRSGCGGGAAGWECSGGEKGAVVRKERCVRTEQWWVWTSGEKGGALWPSGPDIMEILVSGGEKGAALWLSVPGIMETLVAIFAITQRTSFTNGEVPWTLWAR
jgi:hypothetical protein